MSNRHPKARRTKRYTPRPIHPPMIIASALVLGPLIAILDRLEIDGTVNVDERGDPILQDGDGNWYEAAGGIEGLIWHLEMHAARHSVSLPLDGLRELERAFRFCSPVQSSTIRKLRQAMPMLQRLMATADPEDQLDLLQQTRIKAAMEPSK
ncbi:hypothetical protein KVP10_08340 [Candidimonas humi]|uniref:Uncharacterized protein n=1 Tax=Candidimonas humi TaxID=683355 RepID=A0ABV8NXP8_9BURK|nr:hypothetical protein [Candidimonas humi]MBV6304894.1 hypothetical protein [Candidimonas humi]